MSFESMTVPLGIVFLLVVGLVVQDELLRVGDGDEGESTVPRGRGVLVLVLAACALAVAVARPLVLAA